MKELSIKQKAQRYDEAIEIAKAAHKDEDRHLKATLERIFPELKESEEDEDEKIRKNLLGYIRGVSEKEVCKETLTEWISWLEKQGKQKLVEKYNITGIGSKNAQGKLGEMIKNLKSADKVEPKFHEGEWITNGDTVTEKSDWELVHEFVEKFGRIPKDEDELNSLVYYVLKGRINSKFSKDDTTRINEIIETLNIVQANRVRTQRMHYNKATIDKNIDWLKSLKERIQPQPNQEWSEEDEQYLLVCKNALKKYQVTDKWDSNIILQWLNNKLKSLGPHNNIIDEELAQAKKNAYNDALDKIEYHSGEPTFDDGWSAAIDYIQKKFIRPQNQWKPSDEQMNALEYYMHTLVCNEHKEILFGLYADLKKLREENL